MIANLYNYYVVDRLHRVVRISADELNEQYAKLKLSPEERMTRRFEHLTSLETPRIHPLEQIVLTRSIKNLPDVLTEDEWAEIKSKHYIHELGYVSNLSPDYASTISLGLLKVRETANEYQDL